MYAGLNGLKGLKGVMGSERFKGLKTVLGSKRTRVLGVAAVGLVLVGVAAAVCLELPAGQALPARLRELARSWLRGLARDGPDGEQFVPTKPVPTPPPVAPSPGYRRPDLPGEGLPGWRRMKGVLWCCASSAPRQAQRRAASGVGKASRHVPWHTRASRGGGGEARGSCGVAKREAGPSRCRGSGGGGPWGSRSPAMEGDGRSHHLRDKGRRHR